MKYFSTCVISLLLLLLTGGDAMSQKITVSFDAIAMAKNGVGLASETDSKPDYNFTYFLDRSTDYGRSWHRLSAKLPTGHIYELACSNGTTFIAGCIAGFTTGHSPKTVILLSNDSGMSWKEVYSDTNVGSITNFCTLGNGLCFAGSQRGSILKSIDGGISWQNIGGPSGELIRSIAFGDEKHGVAVGGYEIFRTLDGGSGWEECQFDPGVGRPNFFSVSATDASYLVVGCERIAAYDTIFSLVMRSLDQGSEWKATVSNLHNPFSSVASPTSNCTIAVGNSGTIDRSINSGISWEPVQAGTVAMLNRVYFLDGQTGFIVGEPAALLRTSDGGLTWNKAEVTE